MTVYGHISSGLGLMMLLMMSCLWRCTEWRPRYRIKQCQGLRRSPTGLKFIFPKTQKGPNRRSNIGIVINSLEYSYEPTTRELQLTGPETRSLWLTRDHLMLQGGILCYSWANLEGRSECLVVPMELRPRVL